jgi:hypothetical protein
VKWFKDWLVKLRGEDLLRGQVWLLRPDIKHHIVVKAPMRFRTPDDVIRTAEEVLRLYHAALEGRKDPRWWIDRGGNGRIKITVRDAFEFPPPPDLLVENVLILAEGKDRGSISTIESGAGGFDDISAARSNIQSAAHQVPNVDGAGDVCCVCIGSAVPQDSDDVKAVLHGRDDGTGGPGIFDPQSEEPGYAHLHGVVHFSIWFEAMEGEPEEVAVRRSFKLFNGPKAMSDPQCAFLEKVLVNYAKDEVVRL